MSQEPSFPIFPNSADFPPPPPAPPLPPAGPEPCSSGSGLRLGGIVLFCLAVGFLLAAVENLVRIRNQLRDELVEAQQRYGLLTMQRDAQMELLTDPRSRVIVLHPHGAARELGTARIAWRADHREGVFVAEGLRAPRQGDAYQLWFSDGPLDRGQRTTATALAYPQGVQSFSLPLSAVEVRRFFVVEAPATAAATNPAGAEVVFEGALDPIAK